MIKGLARVSLLLAFGSVAWGAVGDVTVAPEIQIKAKPIHAFDEVSYLPYSVTIEQPSSDVYLGETLAKLPGVLVRNTSGFGSLTTVITAGALGAKGTAVSIDDIPVLDPTGAGINFSLFPSTLLRAVEFHSPFYSSLNPEAETLTSPGGRINLRTLQPPKSNEVPWNASVVTGSGKTIEGSGAYRASGKDSDWVVGLSGYNTAGDFQFTQPGKSDVFQNSASRREHNDASGAGGLLKYRTKVGSSGNVEVLDLLSHAGRTNPGQLTPSGGAGNYFERQLDTFNVLGVKYSDPKLITERDGAFAKMAGAYASRELKSSFPSTMFASAGYAQTGYSHRDEASSITVVFDDEYEHLSNDTGKYYRNVFGAAVAMSADLGRFKLVPMARQDAGSNYDRSTDASMSVIYQVDAGSEVLASYGIQHIYPSLTSRAGQVGSGFTVLPNPELKVQRDSITSLAYNRRGERYSILLSCFYDLIQNREAYKDVVPGMTGQFVNADVASWGATVDGQLMATAKTSLRASATFNRALDRETKRQMPFKPTVEAGLSASYLITRELAVSAQEEFMGKRNTSVDSSATVSPFAQTNLRLDASVWKGTLFFKVNNVLNTGGFESPGYPFLGRSFWLGYTL